MIVPGTATVNPSTGIVQISAPMGFGTTRGVRLSNYTTDVLILTNISSVDQSQEYLPPQTQMVYPSVNVGILPTVTGVTLPAASIAANLFVEWSTDPTNDFVGTYPAALPVKVAYQPPMPTQPIGPGGLAPYKTITTFADNNSVVNVGTIPFDYAYIQYTITGVSGNLPFYIQAHETSGTYNTLGSIVVHSQSATGGPISFSGVFPVQLTHDAPLVMVMRALAASHTNSWSASVNIYQAEPMDIPLTYFDMPEPIAYTLSLAPAASGNAQYTPSIGAWQSGLGLIQIPPTQLQLSYAMTTSATGKITYGLITDNGQMSNSASFYANTKDYNVLTGSTFDEQVGRIDVTTNNLNSLYFNWFSTTDTGAFRTNIILTPTHLYGSYGQT